MNDIILNLKIKAEEGKYLYNTNKITRDEAKIYIMPYINAVNEKAKELAKKYNQKYKPVNFNSYIR